MHDWSLLCGAIAFKDCSGLDSLKLHLKVLAWREHRSITGIRGRMLQQYVPSGYCTGNPANFNLLDTTVEASQSYGDVYNTNAR
jgi:hypothetical protein